MKHIYLFNETDSNAAIFGIGRYIEQLINCLSNIPIQVTVVKLFSQAEKVCVSFLNGVRYIDIPCLTPQTADRKQYCRSVAFILLSYISLEDNNLFHYNYLNTANLGIWLKQYIPFSEHILTIHFREPGTFYNYKREKFFLDKVCTKIITLTESAAKSICNDFQLSIDKLITIPHAIEKWGKDGSKETSNRLKKEMGISLNKKILIYVGRFDKNKNPQLLVDAFEILAEELQDIHLIIVGKGNYEEVFSHIRHYGKITFTGFVDKERLKTIYSIADVGIIPSKYEEFGYTALEMMMFGIPVIANRNHGLEAVVKNGQTGLLLDLYKKDHKKSPTSLLAQTIKSLVNDSHRLNTYSNECKKRFSTVFNFSTYKNKMLELYNINQKS